MNLTNRIFPCKNEELTPVSKFTLYSLKRDFADFSAFSTQFTEQYVADMEILITQVETLLEPKTETLAISLIFDQMDQNLDEIKKLLLHIEGYVKLSKKEIGITPAAIGITLLRKSLYRADYEAVLQRLKVLQTNLQTHTQVLETKGMPATIHQTLQELHQALANNKQKQYEIRSNRAALVQNNSQMLNTLYLRMSEIFTIGKVLYKNSDPVKYSDYTFAKLLKKVRNTAPKTPQPETPLQ